MAGAARRDYADAAVAVLTGEGHENKVYELSGDADWSMAELAAELAAAPGSPVAYRDVTADEQVRRRVAAGLPEGCRRASPSCSRTPTRPSPRASGPCAPGSWPD